MPLHSIEAFVLDRSPGGEGFVRLQVLCRESGVRLLLQRAASGTGRGQRPPPPDLFDQVAFEIEARDEGPAFVKDARIVFHPTELPRHWEALQAASRFGRVLLDNRLSPDAAAPLFDLLVRALPAFSSGVRPDCTYLKCLYLLLRDEGYPVREDWALSLPLDAAQDLAALINTPLAAQTVGADRVRWLTRQIETWASHNAELRIPPPA